MGFRKSLRGRRFSLPPILLFCLILSALAYTCKRNCPTISDPVTSVEFSGAVRLSSQPMSGVTVYLSYSASYSKTTGSDGRFVFNNLTGGDYILTPVKLGYSFEPSNYTVGAESRTDLNFTAGPARIGTEEGDVAADCTAADQNGQAVSLYDYHGQVVLMDFTADWCSGCRLKAETAEQLYQSLKNDGFVYILIVTDGDPKVWADTYGLTFPVLDDNDHSIYSLYRRTQIPFPHVLDRNITIRYRKEGWDKTEVEAVIDKYL